MKTITLITALLVLPLTTWAQDTIDFETVGHDFTWKVFGNQEETIPDETVLWNVIDNPDASGANTSSKVMEYTIQNGAQTWAGFWTDDFGPVTFTNDNKIVTIAVRKGSIGPFDLKWENASGSIAEDIIVSNTVTGEWEILSFDCSILLGQTVTRLVILPDFLTSATRPSNGDVNAQFDSITFSSGEVTEPVDRNLIVNGAPFEMRGVNYQPTPIGQNASTSNPFGDYYTSNYSVIYERDLPLIRAMGANTIRIHSWDDTANHDQFLDACYNDGVDPIHVLVNKWVDPNTNWANSSAVNAISSTFTRIDSRLGDHPAVIGIIIGNEANVNGNGDDPDFWAAMNTVAGAIKSQTPSRLVSVAITDRIDQIDAFDSSVPNLDFWCLQSYRGETLGNLFNQYAAASDKPLVLSEFGMDNWDNTNGQPYPDNGQFIADTLSNLWTEIASNSSITAGGCVFSYTDEWWKGVGSPSSQESGGFEQGGFPDRTSNEEWYGLFAVSRSQSGGIDTLTPRASYGALKALWTNSTPKLVNISTRAKVAAGESVVIGGFVIEGNDSLDVLIQGVGSELINGDTLTDSNTLADPIISLVDGNNQIVATNNDWETIDPSESSNAISKAQAMIDAGSFGLGTGSSSSALLENLAPGLYTIVVAGATDGIALVEIYQVPSDTPSDSKLINISTRADVRTVHEIVIGGFAIDGDQNKTVLIQGVGAELINGTNLTAENTLANPFISLIDSANVTVASNDDWEKIDPSESSNAGIKVQAMSDAGSFVLGSGSKSPALVEELSPGSYTVFLFGASGEQGISLIEVYTLD